MTAFNPGGPPSTGSSSSREVDFTAFVFAQDGWITTDVPVRPGVAARQRRVQAGLFGVASGARSSSTPRFEAAGTCSG
jgi:hypothetical protein